MDVLCALSVTIPKSPDSILVCVAQRFKLAPESIRKGGIQNRLDSLESEKLVSEKSGGFVVTDFGIIRRDPFLYPIKWKNGKPYLL